MTKLESVQDIKDSAERIEGALLGSDITAIKTAEAALGQLVDRFCRENEDMLTPLQCRIARQDYEYFRRLVDLALAYYREEDWEK